MELRIVALASVVMLVAGCKSTYSYRLGEQQDGGPVIGKAPVTVEYDPLEYQLTRQGDAVGVRILNPTGDAIKLVGKRSFAATSDGGVYPLLDRYLEPHGYSGMTLPLPPNVYPDWGSWPGHGWAWYDGMSGPYDGGPYYWPSPTYYGVPFPYEWKWSKGPVRIHMAYERAGEMFEHDFEFVRERD